LQYYRSRLELPGRVAMNPEHAGTVNGAWMPTVVFDAKTGVTRERLQVAFAAENIDARVFFHPLSSLPMFTERRENCVAWDLPTRAFNLPSFNDITKEEQDRVIDVVLRLVNG
jgi:perosamine synthetase